MPSSVEITDHRYRCTVHDGEQCDGHCVVTPESILAVADIVTDVTEQPAATSLSELADQLDAAYMRMEDAGIDGAEDVGRAAVFIGEAADATGSEQAILLAKARGLLSGLRDLVEQYRNTD
ncbi:hypothetical protein KYY02_19360 [Streptomyces pimonensis]|uniref:Uncharacterized protein n=1 Tax=Streptomyces pimonensis TaxID=2860288 RepID=A0ABV4J1F7_9ACTN